MEDRNQMRNKAHARAVDAARGAAPFDLLLRRARLVDMATGEIRPVDIGISQGLIAGVHPRDFRSDALQVHDLEGRYVVPGLIDTHAHLESSHLEPHRYADIVLSQGTTTVAWDPHGLANALGLAGVRYAVEATRGLPLRVVLTAPSCVPSLPGLEMSGAEFGEEELRTMLARPEINGVGELMDMAGVLAGTERMEGVLTAARESGLTLHGHARTLSGPFLQAYAAAGVQTDHELFSGEDALEKLRAGLILQIRGTYDYVLPGIVETLLSVPHLGAQATLCTDDLPPDRLLAEGGLIALVRRLVELGLPALTALRLGTLNAALCLRLPDRGLIAPGRLADVMVLNDLASLRVCAVYSGGRLVAVDGRIRQTSQPACPAPKQGPLPLAPFAEEDFRLRIPGLEEGSARLRTIRGACFTQWGEALVRVRAGVAVIPDNCTLLGVQHRYGRHNGPLQLGLLEDWGRFSGAVATTAAHDAHNLLIIGRPEDMPLAANTVIAAGGGIVVVKNGAVLARVDLPAAGIISEAPAEELAAAFARVRERSAEAAEWKPPLRVFSALAGLCRACNPGPHLTDLGLTDGSSRTIEDIVLERRDAQDATR